MRKGKQIIGLLLAVCAVVCVVVYCIHVSSSEYKVSYHKRKMKQAFEDRFGPLDEVASNGLVGYSEGEATERYEFHRKQLVELGAVFKLDYNLNYLSRPSDEGSHFTKHFMVTMHDHCIDYRCPSPSKVQPMALTVWVYPEQKKLWDDLVAERDVPNYREKYMTEKEILP